MQTNDNETFRTKESAFKQFRHTCLGRIVMTFALLVIVLIIAAISKPSPKKMQEEMWDNIRQSIESDGPSDMDAIDVFVDNIGYTFSSADPDEVKDICDLFRNYNDTVFYNDNPFVATMYVQNGVEPERCGIGIFGMVIPTANFKRFLPKDQPRGEYNEQLVQPNTDSEELYGDTPVDVFRFEGE